LDAAANELEIRGRSYPENTVKFYAPVFDWLRTYLSVEKDVMLTVRLELHFYNSSSGKMLFDICDLLEASAERFAGITLFWIYDEDDEDAEEFGREIGDCLSSVSFKLVARPVPDAREGR
jgi:hypothetical protein